MDIKKKGEASLFIRTSPGRYTLRALASQPQPASDSRVTSPVSPMAAAARKPAAAAPSTTRPAGRSDSAEGGGYAS